jgi:hypothetical protein
MIHEAAMSPWMGIIYPVLETSRWKFSMVKEAMPAHTCEGETNARGAYACKIFAVFLLWL